MVDEGAGARLRALIEAEPTEIGEAVRALFMSCLFRDEELRADGTPTVEPVIARGLVCDVGFHPARIRAAKEQVRALLFKIATDKFLKAKGGGCSFLVLCVDRDGNQWTNLHRTQEQLVQLAIGTGLGGYCVPRESWARLPGGVPYIWFDI